ncbi:MAG: hypothetical protein IT521_15775 [Burkholderiales bacterium]|nr:hypothetical protein [Burkholderiales bacterium]
MTFGPIRGRIAAALLPIILGACATSATAPSSAPMSAPAAVAPLPAATAPGPPTVPAGKVVTLVNPGFESTKTGPRGTPEGWFSFQHAGSRSYHFVVDNHAPHGGERSLRIDNVGPEPYGAIAQIIDARPYAGKVARLTGWLKTRGADDNGAVLTLLVQRGGATTAQNFMQDSPVKGSTGWTRYTITLPVAEGAERLEIGAMLLGRGTLWLDDAELEFVSP